MATVNELKRLIAIQKKKELKEREIIGKAGEKAKLRKQLFELKHRKKLRLARGIGLKLKTAGSNLKYNVSGASSDFQKQRKAKKGVGGFLQRIADNQ